LKSTPTSDSSDEIRQVLDATDPWALFGDNKARATIRYRRLARVCHPDMGGSDAAMAHLNELWGKYANKPKPGHASLTEITRGNAYAVFSEGDEWLVVRRDTGSSIVELATSSLELAHLISGSPVCVASVQGVKRIKQPDGTHVAYVCTPPDTVGKAIMLPSLAEHIPGGALDPADLAWITKRVIFLAAAIAKCGLRFTEDPCECLAIDPESHMLCAIAPWALKKSDNPSIKDQRDVTTSFYGCLGDVIGVGWKSKRIEKFLYGTYLDGYTESSYLLEEFDGLLLDLFGKPKFHEMQVV